MGGGGGKKGGKKGGTGPKKRTFRSWKNMGNPGDDAAGSTSTTSKAQKQFQSRVSEGRSGFHGGSKGQSYSDFRKQQDKANRERLQAEARAREAAKKAEATRKNKFDPNRLYSGTVDASAFTGPGLNISGVDSGKFSASRLKTRYSNKDYLTTKPYTEALKRTFFGDGLQGNRFNPVDRAAALGAGYTDSVIGLANFAKNRLVPFGKLAPNIPTLPKFQDPNLQGLRNFGSVVIPGLQTFGAAQRLSKVGLGQEIGQMTLRNDAFKAGVRPTLTKTGITGVGPLTIAKAFTPGMLKTGPTAGGSAAILGTATGLQGGKALQAGGLNIGTTEAGDESEGGEEGTNRRSFTSRALGALDSFTSDAFDFDGLGRSGMPKSMQSAVLGGADIASALNQGAIGQTKDTFNAIKNLSDQAVPGDETAIKNQMKILTQNLGKEDSEFATLNRGIKAFTTDDENLKGFREFAKDVKDTFTPGAPGLSPREIGGKGSTLIEKFGKNLVANNLTNIVNEGDKSFGVEPGSARIKVKSIQDIKNAIDYGKNIYKNINTKDSLSSKAAGNIAALTGQGTKAPTAGTILKRYSGRGGGRGGASSSPISSLQTGTQRPSEVPLIEPIPVAPQTDTPNLQSITQEAYQKRLAQLKQLTPLPPVIQQTRRPVPQFNFRTAFNRNYFA